MEEELLDNKINLRNKAIKYNVLTLDLDSNKSTIKRFGKKSGRFNGLYIKLY